MSSVYCTYIQGLLSMDRAIVGKLLQLAKTEKNKAYCLAQLEDIQKREAHVERLLKNPEQAELLRLYALNLMKFYQIRFAKIEKLARKLSG